MRSGDRAAARGVVGDERVSTFSGHDAFCHGIKHRPEIDRAAVATRAIDEASRLTYPYWIHVPAENPDHTFTAIAATEPVSILFGLCCIEFLPGAHEQYTVPYRQHRYSNSVMG